MATKSKPWQTLEGNTARCARCGGLSQFRPMMNWYSRSTGRPKRFSHWDWWKRFKQVHRTCPNRLNYDDSK